MNNIIFNRILYTLLGVIGVTTFYLVSNFGENYFVLFILIIPIYFAIHKNKKEIIRYKFLEKVRKNWGKRITRKRDFNKLNKFFNLTIKQNNNEYIINDQTWEDLNMNALFEDIDRTSTNCGENVLYRILRTVLLDKKALIKRNELIKFFIENKNIKERIQSNLAILDWRKDDNSGDILFNEINYKKNIKILANIMRIISISSLILIKFIGLRYIFVAIMIGLINQYIISKTKKDMDFHKSSIKIIRDTVITAKALSKLDNPVLSGYVDKLKAIVDKCERVIKVTNSLFIVDSDPLGISIYIKTLFLLEINSFYKASEAINSLRNELKEIYMTIGELDALISIASYRDGLSDFIEPEFEDNTKHIYVEDIIHPLISEPISNSIEINNHSIIVTGSNMSGKSTFLRTLGINALLAQTIFICHAKKYKGSIFRIMTSISRNDNINEGKSYYLREAELLLDMINNLDNIPSLIIIDEIFRGTNTAERIEASSRILSYFSNNNALVIVATHDLELNNLVSETFESYHFSEKVGQEGLEFDYMLKKGVSQTRNAIKILKYLGYPEEIAID